MMTRNRILCWASLAFGLLSTVVSAADEPTGIEFFEKKIRPVLVQHCYDCHSADAKALKAGLLLDSRDGWKQGGDSGPAIVPGKPSESLLIQALKYEDGMEMPPKGKLSDEVVADFVKWIEQGAPDPRKAPAKAIARARDRHRGRQTVVVFQANRFADSARREKCLVAENRPRSFHSRETRGGGDSSSRRCGSSDMVAACLV